MLAKARVALADGKTPTMDELAAATGVSRAALYQLFGSRQTLLDALGVQPAPTMRDRIVTAAAELLAERGLVGLSLDEVATRAGASRATVYRLFPGKAALFREVVHRYVPLEEGVELLEAMRDRPPTEVMPLLAASVARAGHLRVGVLRSLLFEVTGGAQDSEEVLADSLRGLAVLIGYLAEQMAAGRLRPMHPMLAFEAFMGPIVLHLISRPIVEERLSLDLPLDEAVAEFAASWLRAMTPSRRRSGK